MLCALQGDELQEHRELAQVGEVWEGFPDEVVLEPNLGGCDTVFILGR